MTDNFCYTGAWYGSEDYVYYEQKPWTKITYLYPITLVQVQRGESCLPSERSQGLTSLLRSLAMLPGTFINASTYHVSHGNASFYETFTSYLQFRRASVPRRSSSYRLEGAAR